MRMFLWLFVSSGTHHDRIRVAIIESSLSEGNDKRSVKEKNSHGTFNVLEVYPSCMTVYGNCMNLDAEIGSALVKGRMRGGRKDPVVRPNVNGLGFADNKTRTFQVL